ncbi:D-amino-acid transaminase [Sporosarcina sp. CAU 1771]
MTDYFINGRYTKQDGVNISIDDRGYYFGDGVYEVIKVYEGKLYTEEEHISRLFESAHKIRIDVPYTKNELIEISKELVLRNEISCGHVYMQVTRGIHTRQHQFPDSKTTPVVTAYAIENERPIGTQNKGVAVKAVEDVRWLRCDIKSLNLLGSVLAKQEAFDAGCAEAILHRDGIVTEGSSTNMFAIKDGVVFTHPVSNLILNGITRQVVLALCEENQIPFKEKSFTIDEVFEMDEVFYTSTTAEVMPVVTIDGQEIGSGKPGPITRQLQVLFGSQIPSPAAKVLRK